MWETVKKSLAFGLGAAVLTADKVREFADEAVNRGEMSSDEAKGFIDDVIKRGDEEKRNVQNWMREQANKIMKDAGCADASRVEALERRVRELEAQMAEDQMMENEE
ncbi:MAG: hypothetical protein ABFD46_08775 [Armatimonadota bacterium]